jgi:hypothetical protein
MSSDAFAYFAQLLLAGAEVIALTEQGKLTYETATNSLANLLEEQKRVLVVIAQDEKQEPYLQ